MTTPGDGFITAAVPAFRLRKLPEHERRGIPYQVCDGWPYVFVVLEQAYQNNQTGEITWQEIDLTE